ncbi:hypothetical protein ROHU_025767 [Labeo rohita]|uniref:Uncharacterized protein n=1 Tax=Labeo rohita TaxID=84645 RepID=A0A498MQQ4_LABRO|nr:hypothetical protein ROHU_025767 [Labeo rohita]
MPTLSCELIIELPGIVSSLKDVLESMKRGPYSSRSSSNTVIKEFPKTTVSEVRALIWRKCNNESTSKNSHSPLEG